jgi:hypothetical protein
MDEGRFTIPARIYLTAEERAKLEHLLEAEEHTLDDLLTELVAAFLAGQPDPPPSSRPASGAAEELRRRRAELRRLRPKLNDPHNPPPAWLTAMATELEAEIRRLEAAPQQGPEG